MRNKLQDLYGNVDSSRWATMPYKEVLELKIKLAKTQLKVISEVHYTKMDMSGMNNCLKAIKFNEELLDELK